MTGVGSWPCHWAAPRTRPKEQAPIVSNNSLKLVHMTYLARTRNQRNGARSKVDGLGDQHTKGTDDGEHLWIPQIRSLFAFRITQSTCRPLTCVSQSAQRSHLPTTGRGLIRGGCGRGRHVARPPFLGSELARGSQSPQKPAGERPVGLVSSPAALLAASAAPCMDSVDDKPVSARHAQASHVTYTYGLESTTPSDPRTEQCDGSALRGSTENEFVTPPTGSRATNKAGRQSFSPQLHSFIKGAE
jgi:hypothetical protein